MLFLWIFGNNVEDAMGRVAFVVFYLLGGLAALALQVRRRARRRRSRRSARPARSPPCSAATSCSIPRARVVTLVFIIFFFTIVELPAMLVLGALVRASRSLFGALRPGRPAGGGGGVAYFAHIGGFVFGLLAIRLFAQRRAAVPPPRRMATMRWP